MRNEMTPNKEIVGIVGSSGELGSKLVKLIQSHSMNVMLSDISVQDGCLITELLAKCSIVHICAPLSAVDILELPGKDTLVILHDSVMSTSREFNNKALNGQGSIVHMLMNKQNKVIVEFDAPNKSRLIQHLSLIGLNPESMSIEEHDVLMARTQAPLALLHEVLSKDLKKYADDGMLTPSGTVLMKTLKNRAIAWTPATTESLLNNPQLDVLVDELRLRLRENNAKRPIKK